MSDAVDTFVEQAQGVRSATSHHEEAHIHVYHGELADRDGTVKILTLAPTIDDAAATEAFMQIAGEWQNASTHPNIVTVYDRGETPRPWVATADVDGQPLDAAQPNLEPAERATVVADAAEAIRNAALYNIVHRALSPEHIVVVPGEDGVSAVVDDWGLRQAVQTAVDELDITPYTAPELLEDSGAGNERTDVYGLGTVGYYALTGAQPVSGADLAAAIREGDVTPPSEFDETLSEAVDEALLQALAIEPDDRHESAYTFKRAFVAAYSPEPAEDDDGTATAAGAAAVDAGDENESVTDDTGDDESSQTTRRMALGALGLGVVGLSGGWLATQMGGGDDTPVTGETSEEPTEDSPAGTTVPSISAFSLSNPSGQELRTSFESDEELATIQVSISGPESAVLTAGDFSESGGGGTQTYEAIYPANSDGEYIATLDEAADESGNDGASGQSMNVLVDTEVATGQSEMWPQYGYDAANTGYAPSNTSLIASANQQWNVDIGFAIKSNPAVVADRVFVTAEDGNVHSLLRTDGSEDWNFKTDTLDSSVSVDDGTLYCGGDAFYAINAESGSQRWRFTDRNADVFRGGTISGGTVYAGSDNAVYAIDAATGAEEWRFEISTYVAHAPTVTDQNVYISTSNRETHALSRSDGIRQWSVNVGFPDKAPAVMDESVYVAGQNLTCLSLADGSTQWTYETNDRVSTSPALADGTVFLGTTGSIVYALDADTGSELWRFRTTDEIHSDPTIADETVYIGDEGGAVYALSIDEGSERWSLEVGGSVRSSPPVVDGTVYVGSLEGDLFTLTGETPELNPEQQSGERE